MSMYGTAYYQRTEEAKFSDLVGQTLTEVKGLKDGGDEVLFQTSDDKTYLMAHSQDCCESVSIHDLQGSADDLLNTPILTATEEVSNTNPADYTPGEYGQDSFTWTFYRIGTIKGTVVIRWYGESNGYYSESVDFYELKEKEA